MELSVIERLQYISLCKIVGEELETHIGCKDKALVEFIIELCKRSGSMQHFKGLLEENEAELTD